MKKILLLLLFAVGQNLSAQPVLTTIVDATCPGGVPKVIEIYAQGTVDFSQYGFTIQSNGGAWNTNVLALSPLGTVTNDYVYLISGSTTTTQLTTEFPSTAGKTVLQNNYINFNGDDGFRLIDLQGNVIDQYGVNGVDGTGEVWEYKDSYAKRLSGTLPSANFNPNDWDFGTPGFLTGKGSCNNTSNFETSISGIQTYVAPTSCLPPLQGQTGNITDTFAILAWTTQNSNATWQIEYGITGFTPGTGTVINNVTSNPYVLSGLSNGTTYDWYVRSNCGNNNFSNWSGPYSFTTLCSVYTPDYFEGFDTYLPNCWREAKGNLGNLSYVNSRWTYDGFLNNGTTGSARIYMYGTYIHTHDYLISPVFDLSSGTNYELTFKVGVTAFSNSSAVQMGADDGVELLISTDGGVSWGPLMTWNSFNSPSNTGDFIAINLNNYSSNNVVFAFIANTGSVANPGYNFYVDDFAVTGNTCQAPSGLNTTITGNTSTILSWNDNTGGVANYFLEWKPVNGSNWQNINLTAGTTNHHLSGLTPDTEYQWRITAVCSDSDVTVSGNNFIPTCVPIVPDYLETFDNYLSDCWFEAKDNGSGPYPANSRWTNDGFINNGTTGAARVVLYNSAFDSWLVSPVFNLSNTNYYLDTSVAITKFSGTQSSPMGSDDYVKLKITTDGGNTWTDLYTWNINNPPTNIPFDISINLSNYMVSQAQFAFVASNGQLTQLAYNFYIDYFHIHDGNLLRNNILNNNNISSKQIENKDKSIDVNISNFENTYTFEVTDNIPIDNIRIFNMYQQLIFKTENINKIKQDIYLSNKSNTILICKIYLKNGEIITKKIFTRQ